MREIQKIFRASGESLTFNSPLSLSLPRLHISPIKNLLCSLNPTVQNIPTLPVDVSPPSNSSTTAQVLDIGVNLFLI